MAESPLFGGDDKTESNWVMDSRRSLFEAVRDDKESVVRELVNAGMDVNITYRRGKTILFYAVQDGNERMVNLLIEAGADVNVVDNEGKTALFYAVENDNESVVDLLISNDADVNIKAPKYSDETALSYAVQNCNECIVDKLIAAGADVNAIYGYHDNALIMAVRKNKNSLIIRLIDAGGDVNIIDGNGTTPLWIAALRGNGVIVSKLIKAGADVNTPTFSGLNAFHCTLINFHSSRYEEDHLKIVQIFVEDGHADVNGRNEYGKTPLFYSLNYSVSTSSYLIEKGANLFLNDNHNVSILSSYLHSTMSKYARLSNACDLQGLDLLLQHGVKRDTVFETTINVLFCRVLDFNFFRDEDEIQSLCKMLELARDFISNNCEDSRKKNEIIIDELLSIIKNEFKDARSYYESTTPRILDSLIKLGANPDSVDSSGNTALHYAAKLPGKALESQTVMKICHQLKSYGSSFNVKNHEEETPLLFSLKSQSKVSHPGQGSEYKMLIEVCNFLLDHGASVEEATREGDTAFHYIMELFDNSFRYYEMERLHELIKLCQLFFDSKLQGDKTFTVNRRKANGFCSPLHQWASLRFSSYSALAGAYVKTLFEDYTFEKLLKFILSKLLEFGAKLDDRNGDDQSPLHLCGTWTAVNLLLDAGANVNVVDSSGRSPILSSAKRLKRLKNDPRKSYSQRNMTTEEPVPKDSPTGGSFLNDERLYPDVGLEPQAFWRAALQKGLDLWTVDKHGESVLSVLVGAQEYVLSKALVEVARDDNYLQSETIAASLLNAICKDKSTRAHWKSNLVEIILKSTRNPVFRRSSDSPLHMCCKNIVERFKDSFCDFKENKDIDRMYDNDIDDDDNEVNWTIAKLLLAYGADCKIPDSTGQSCLDIAEEYLPLKQLLTKPLNDDEIPLLIPWTSVSREHEIILAKVARRQESKHVESFWYHQDHLASGSFGAVFAGINEKDGREVAIKRIEKRHMQRPEDKREITNLAALENCEQVVRYLCFFEDEYFSYVVLELMEGNLEQCLDKALRLQTRVQFCQDVVTGLQFLHALNILHRDLKPTNILYRTHPKICLKIADFGLSRRIDSIGTTVYGPNAGTRCWIAPEVVNSTKDPSKSLDMFSCGLVLHYILSVKKHPFAPADCTNKSALLISFETESNVLNDKIEGWDHSLCPEATHLVTKMLESDVTQRPTSEKAPSHPLFWPKKKKVNLLVAVGNQNPEFTCPRVRRSPPLSAVEMDLETNFGTILRRVPTWNDPRNLHMPGIYSEMTRRRSPYDTRSVVELVRFIRNAYAHVTEISHPNLLLEDFVFLEYFPNLVMEVYKAVTTHGWDQTREEIKHSMK